MQVVEERLDQQYFDFRTFFLQSSREKFDIESFDDLSCIERVVSRYLRWAPIEVVLTELSGNAKDISEVLYWAKRSLCPDE